MSAVPVLRSVPSIHGRPPPHDLEAEAAVVSSILLRPAGLDDVIGFLRAEHFHSPANAGIFRAIRALAEVGSPIDTVQVATWLRARDQLASIGGAAYLGQVIDATPAVHNVVAHARTVERKARMRAIIAEAHTIAAEGYFDVGDEDEWIDAAEARMARLGEGTAQKREVTMADALTRAWTTINAELNDDAPPAGGCTGLTDLDDLMGPLRGKRVTVVGAYWGDGKSALGVQIAMATAMQKRASADRSAALLISVEMGDEELAQRALFMEARVDSSKARPNKSRYITDHEWRALQDAVTVVGRQPVWIDDREDMGAIDVAASVRRHKAAAGKLGFKLRVVVVDYLQLLDGRAGLSKGANREQEVATLSRAMKRIAKAEDVHVVILAQLNDDASKRTKGDQRPSSRDFRESKAIAMNADNIVLVYNPQSRERAAKRHSAHGERPSTEPEEVELILGKHRGGPTGTVKSTWYPAITLFGNAEVGT